LLELHTRTLHSDLLLFSLTEINFNSQFVHSTEWVFHCNYSSMLFFFFSVSYM